jgi:hypothetical protein
MICIVQVLKNSPNLRKLKLSLSRDAVARHNSDDMYQFVSWFDQLCNVYGELRPCPRRR